MNIKLSSLAAKEAKIKALKIVFNYNNVHNL